MFETPLGNLERWLFEPPESIYGQPLWKLTRILRYPYALIRDILRGDLTLRAMSLVYTTLLSIVPLIAVSFSVLKGLGYHRELEPVLYAFLEPLGDRGYELTRQITTFVDNVRGDVIGSLGVLFLLYYTMSMIQKVEESFNFVWRVEQPRSLMRGQPTPTTPHDRGLRDRDQRRQVGRSFRSDARWPEVHHGLPEGAGVLRLPFELAT